MQFPNGSIEQIVFIEIVDTSGAPLTGLAFDSAGLQAYYVLPRETPTQIPLVELSDSLAAWAEGGFIEVDAVNMPGIYRFDLPNSFFNIAFGTITLVFSGAATMQVKTELITLLPRIVSDAMTIFTIDGTYFLADYLLIIGAAVAGKISGAEGTNVVVRDILDSVDVLHATVDADGNRTDVQVVF